MSQYHQTNLIQKFKDANLLTPIIEKLLTDYFRPKSTAKKLGMDDKIPFGKHQGKTFNSVKISDPQYYEWAYNNMTNIFNFPYESSF